MACECVSCSSCGGSGNVWWSFPGLGLGGKYLGNHRSDDLDEMETCEECGGSGIIETCYECQEADECDQDSLTEREEFESGGAWRRGE